MAASLLGKAEVLYQKLTHNHQADFWYTRREEDAPWFALMGMVANDVLPETPPKNATNFLPHEVFRIGSGCTFTPQKSGYLYAFANDAWQLVCQQQWQCGAHGDPPSFSVLEAN
jgi:hypothetical protein